MARQLGVMLLQNRSVGELTQWARLYDGAGADAVYVADHLTNPFDPTGEWQDGWLSLVAVASATSRCRIGTLVTTFVLHSPSALARMAMTGQAISGGRLVLGVGAGGAPIDRSLSSVHDDRPGLAARLDSGLATLRSLLDGGAVELPPVPEIGGRIPPAAWSLDEAARRTARPELMVGGQATSTMRAAVTHADAWNAFGGRIRDGESGLDLMARHLRRIDELCAEAGRDPGTLRRTVLLDFVPDLAPTTDDDLAGVTERLWELGYDEVIAYAWFGRDQGPRTPESLLGFVDARLPQLR